MRLFCAIFAQQCNKYNDNEEDVSLLALFTLLAGGVSAQVANVNPRPQTVNSTGKLFTAPKEWRVYSTYALATSYAMDALEEIGVARAKGGRGTFRVTLGLTTDKENAKYRQLVPNHPDALLFVRHSERSGDHRP